MEGIGGSGDESILFGPFAFVFLIIRCLDFTFHPEGLNPPVLSPKGGFMNYSCSVPRLQWLALGESNPDRNLRREGGIDLAFS